MYYSVQYVTLTFITLRSFISSFTSLQTSSINMMTDLFVDITNITESRTGRIAVCTICAIFTFCDFKCKF